MIQAQHINNQYGPQQPSHLSQHYQASRNYHLSSLSQAPRGPPTNYQAHQARPQVRPGHVANVYVPAQQQQQRRLQEVPPVCQIPDELLPFARCPKQMEERFRKTAVAEFKLKLDETSLELRQLLSSHLHEFRGLSLGLLLVAQNDTINRLRQASHQHDHEARGHAELATRRLFDSMYSHLQAFDAPSPGQLDFELASHQHQARPTTAASINQEIANYFRKLHLIHLKRLLEQRPLEGQSEGRELSFDCLDNNLASQQKVEAVLNELVGGKQQVSSGLSPEEHLTALQVEQDRLGQAMRQSLEFARTLLGSLKLASEMFANITRQLDDWMPSQACHAALTRMTVCQSCYPAPANHLGSPEQLTGARQPSASPPCENYCLNVARGCMNDLFELNRFWAEHVGALARFKTNMIQTNNIENVMSSLDEKLAAFVGRLQQQYSTSSMMANLASSEQPAGLPLSTGVSISSRLVRITSHRDVIQ